MKPSLALLGLVTAAVAVPVSAQHVVFHDGFESGLSNWTATGLWNLEDSSDPCGGLAAPFVEGTKAAWYGIEGPCNFETGTVANAGSLSLNAWIDLPNAPSISLRFWTWIHSEYCWASFGTPWDVHTVGIAAQNGPDAGFSQQLCSENGPSSIQLPWHERRIDLSAYRGARVRVTFYFDSQDGAANDMLGWLLDDVSIIAEPGVRVCPTSSLNSGCPCAIPFVPVAGGCRNSTQQSATLLSGGNPAVGQDTLTFTATHMTPTTTALLVQGTAGIAPVAFGDGLRCVGGSKLRMGSLTAVNGAATWPAPGTPALSLRGLLPPAGATRYYAANYRDTAPYCNGATFNLTDAQRIVWTP